MSPKFTVRIMAGLCMAVFLALPLAAAAQAPKPPQQPSPDRLLHVPVGGTRIPHDAALAVPRNPYEGNGEAITQGRALFKSMNCIGCHAAEGGGGMGPPLSDTTWIYGGEPAQIYLTIVQGRPNGMPSFGNALPSDEVWKLVSYVRSLSHTPPDRPQQSGKP